MDVDPRRAKGLNRRHFLGGALLAGGTLAAGATGMPRAAAATPAAAPSAVLPSRAAVLGTLRLVNDHWIGAHTDPGNNQWARATYFSGNMAAYRATGEPRYLSYARAWGEKNNYGLNGGVATRFADNHTAGQAYFDLYDVDGDPAYVADIVESLRRMTHGTNTSNSDWTWVDALHMAMPNFVRVASYLNDTAYLDKLWSLYSFTKHGVGGTGLYDYTDELWFRDANYLWPGGSGSHSPNGAKVYWSRGNGWAFAAHAKVLGLLPPGDNRWPEYRYNPQGLGRALLTRQRADGFWNVNLADPLQHPGPETSGTALFTFGLAYAVRTGVISRTTYLPVLARAYNGMVATAVHPDGLLGYVQNVGLDPDSSQPVTYDSTADFGVGAFLLAAAEVVALTV
jgi:rhamnogalacturonyl hydrolase YesR